MSKASKTSVSSRPYHHGNLREALVKAAVELVSERGARGFTLREVARRAGVSHTAPYRHFNDREALLAAVAEEGFKGLDDAIVAARAEHEDDLATAHRAMGMAYLRYAMGHPAHYRIMFGDAVENPFEYPSLSEIGLRSFERLVQIISDCQQAGLITKAAGPDQIALLLWSTTHGLALLLLDGRIGEGTSKEIAGNADELWNQITAMLYLGLAPR